MERNENGLIIVRNIKDLNLSRWWSPMYVYAICPKCESGWSSLDANAEKILTKGCLGCSDEWDADFGLIVN